MNDNTHKYLDDLSKKVIIESKVERPSFNFTNEIMYKVEALSKNQVTVYKPLISKTAWVLISVGFLAVIFYAVFTGNENSSTSWFSEIDFSLLSNNSISNTFSSFKFSKTLMYAVVFFGVMICVQIPFLKNYFDKRFEV